MTKEQARRLVRERRARVAAPTYEAAAEALRRRAAAALAGARCVMAFAPLPDELDVRPLLEGLLRSGVRLFLPRVEGPGTMVAKEVRDLAVLRPGRFGVAEPPAEAEEGWAFDVVLVPGVAFTPAGGRVGRGGGYYDRFLPKTRGLRLALAFAFQCVEDVAFDPWDVPVDRVLWQPLGGGIDGGP